MNEPDELERRLDAALRRRFEPPASLDTLAERLRNEAEAGGLGLDLRREGSVRARVHARLGDRFLRLRPRARPARPRWPLLLLAAAACVAAVLGARAWGPRERDGREHRSAPGARREIVRLQPRLQPVEAELASCRLLPAPGAAPRASSLVQSPDLARLYRDMDACQRGANADECEDDELLARHLEALSLRPDAAVLAHGPFLSDEWPTGQILTMSIDDQTVAVVVERRSTLDCCVHPQLEESSGLQCFTWTKGEFVLAEITPHGEPRMIPYLE